MAGRFAPAVRQEEDYGLNAQYDSAGKIIPPTYQAPLPVKYRPAAQGAMAGLTAGESANPSYDATGALVNVGTSALEGAAAGFVAGGPVGAAVGGGVALVTSGLNAWLSVRDENKRKHDREAILKAAQKRQDKIDNQARMDALQGMAYDRRQTAFQNASAQASVKMQDIWNILKNNQALKDRYLQTGIPNAV